MPHYVTLTTVVVGLILFGWSSLSMQKYLRYKGISYLFGAIAMRAWAISCAWHAFRTEYLSAARDYQKHLDETHLRRMSQLA